MVLTFPHFEIDRRDILSRERALSLSLDNAYAYTILLSSLLLLDIGLSEAIKREVSQRVDNFPPSWKTENRTRTPFRNE